jgi:uncharacterized protein YndB with AHSA1/START domain
MSTAQAHKEARFTLVHEFNAPKQLVFNAFATAEALGEWWGPAESKVIVVKLDFKPGGIFHYKTEPGPMYGRLLFGKIQPFDLLEFTSSFSDENANIIKPPFDMPFPLEIFNRAVFTEQDGKTTITMTAEPVNASTDEVNMFKNLHSNMQQGTTGMMHKLALYLSKK